MSCSRFCEHQQIHSAWDDKSLSLSLMHPFDSMNRCSRLHNVRKKDDFYYKEAKVEYSIWTPRFNHALALLTSPRPVPSVSDTESYLWSAGIDTWSGPKILFHDGPIPSPEAYREYWSIYGNNDSTAIHFSKTEQLGCAKTFINLLSTILIAFPEIDKLTFFEDDIQLSRNALEYIAHVEIPSDVAFISWFTYPYDWSVPKNEKNLDYHIRKSTSPIWGIRPSRYFILSQGLTIPKRTIERIIHCPFVVHSWPKRDGLDEMIAYALGDEPYATHFPGIVQHAGGLNSAVSMDLKQSQDAQQGERKSPYYLGNSFDCLDLPNVRFLRK